MKNDMKMLNLEQKHRKTNEQNSFDRTLKGFVSTPSCQVRIEREGSTFRMLVGQFETLLQMLAILDA